MIFAMNKQSSSISRARSDLTRMGRRTKLCKVRSLAIKGDSNYVVKAAAAAATATTKINQTFQDAEKATKSPRTAEEIKLSIQRQIATGTIPAIPTYFDNADMYQATAQAAREQLAERWNDTYAHFHKENPKQAYYISMEFLQGRALTNAIGNMGMTGAYSDALRSLGYSLEECAEEEKNMGLGNGGLGRLAACFLDSIATLSLPAWGYGMRYKYGLFKQAIDQQTGQQMEYADDWLVRGNPWEIPRPQIKYPISFYGEVTKDGKWIPGKQVDAVAYDTPIPGYGTKNCISLRLWDAQPIVSDFNLTAHNAEDYQTSMGPTNLAQQIMAVLYPGDATKVGKALRLSQQYMLCSASVQDILMRFKERGNTDWQKLPEKVCVQMNDTHPTLAAPELMRLLMDQEGMKFDAAWELTKKTVAYTNHTVMPEALEKWPLDLMEELLPRHMQIIRQIDQRFIEEATAKFAGKKNEQEMAKFLKATTILENVYQTHVDRPMMGDTMEKRESPPATVRMANLCCIAGLSINGVAQIHSDIVKAFTFKEFAEIYGHKFQNKTNGVTPRRWLAFCNPELSKVITKWCGSDKWITDTEVLRKLMDNAKNPELQKEWKDAKIARKQICKDFIKAKTGIDVPADAMFDIQVKRIHEYKRQLLNILGIIYRYRQIKAMSKEERKKVTPRVCVFGGKAYATYIQAKRIVRLVTAVGDVVNNDPEIGDLMKVVFVPDYNVSVAETLIPASELSQHISTAGTEASGTSNMKFQMNGCLIIGTLDGANVEIRECVGDDNFFLFGIEEDEVEPAREERANGKFKAPQSFLDTIQFIRSGAFGKPGEFEQLLGSLEGNSGFGQGDYFLVGKDFQSYIECQAKVDVAYKNQERWTESSILSTATSGKFNSDRTIDQYAKEIWGIKKCVVP